MPQQDQSQTRLSEQEFRACLSKTRQFLRDHESVRNETLRSISGISYDQAISFFNRAIQVGALERRGRAGGTHYVLGPKDCDVQGNG